MGLFRAIDTSLRAVPHCETLADAYQDLGSSSLYGKLEISRRISVLNGDPSLIMALLIDCGRAWISLVAGQDPLSRHCSQV